MTGRQHPDYRGERACDKTCPHEPHSWSLAAIDGYIYDCPGVSDPTAASTEGVTPETVLRDLAELAVTATLPLLPLSGSWDSGYRVSEHIDPVLHATPQEWAEAAWAIARLQEAIRDH